MDIYGHKCLLLPPRSGWHWSELARGLAMGVDDPHESRWQKQQQLVGLIVRVVVGVWLPRHPRNVGGFFGRGYRGDEGEEQAADTTEVRSVHSKGEGSMDVDTGAGIDSKWRGAESSESDVGGSSKRSR